MSNTFFLGSKLVLLNGLAMTLPLAATNPSPANQGDMYFNTVSDLIMFYDGTTWQTITDSNVSIVTANGFAGTVSSGAITLTTTLTTPVVAANGTALIAGTTTGSGSTVVLQTSPTLITPNLDTPSTLVLTNATGTPTSLGLANATGLSLTTGVTGILPIANGGTNSSTAAGAFNNLSPMTTTGDTIYEASAGVAARLPIGTTGQVLTVVGGIPAWVTDTDTSGTVTSVALADGSTTPIYTISGSPVTTAGTLTFTLNTETANTVFAGPATGGPSQPTFRALVATDIPTLTQYELVANFAVRTFTTVTLAANVSTPTTIPALTFAFATYGSMKITYQMTETSTGIRRFGTFMCTTDGTLTGYNDEYAETALIGTAPGVLLSAAVSGSNVVIQYTNTDTNTITMRCEITEFPA
jgi:hypothetical protein